MDLVRDLLDKQVLDRNGREMGRVDSVILDLRDDGSAVVSAIDIGLVPFARRSSWLLGRCARALETILGAEDGRPVRLPFSTIMSIEQHVRVDVAVSDTAAHMLEHKARSIVASIPGAR